MSKQRIKKIKSENRISNFYNYTVYKIAAGNAFIFEQFGWWSFDDGLIDLRWTKTLSRRRNNLQGHKLKASTVFMIKGSENHTDLDDYQ